MSSIESPPDEAALRGAQRTLSKVAVRTPLVESPAINERFGMRVLLKLECQQRTGAFKFRGAYCKVASLTEAQRRSGVVATSSGNHAQALARAGQILGIPITVIMPDNAPQIKLEATRGYGATVIQYDRAETTREALAKSLQEKSGQVLVPPFDHPHVVAGQGTAVKELIEEVGSLDLLLVCTGGGGLLSGSAISAKHLSPSCRVVGVEPEAGDDVTRSFQTGTIQSVHNPDTIADGARTHSPSTLTFSLIRQHVDEMVTVPDRALAKTMFFLWERMKIVVEPTGALAATALFTSGLVEKGQRVGVVISGGNVDMTAIPSLLALL